VLGAVDEGQVRDGEVVGQLCKKYFADQAAVKVVEG
jgi:hypothetical protein